MNTISEIEQEFVRVRKLVNENRKIINDNKEISDFYLSCPKKFGSKNTPRKLTVEKYGKDAGKVVNAIVRNREYKEQFLIFYRSVIVLLQAVKYDRLTSEEKQTLIDFVTLVSQIDYDRITYRLRGLKFINVKVMSEALARKLYS